MAVYAEAPVALVHNHPASWLLVNKAFQSSFVRVSRVVVNTKDFRYLHAGPENM